MRVTAFTKYGRRAASTRHRLLQYVPALEAAGIEVDHRPLLDDDYVASLTSRRSYPKSRIARRYVERLLDIAARPLGDVVWIYAELFPFLPAAFERLAGWRGRPIIYDFDDAFFHQYDDHSNRLVRMLLDGKLEPLLKSACACTCGNEYVQAYAAPFCATCIIVPTAVDTDAYVPASRPPRQEPVIGWIGSPSTWEYVRPLLPLLGELAESGRATVRIVGAGAAAESELGGRMQSVEWSEETEIAEVQEMDIGIMPVPDSKWTRGKSGFKIIQYMSCGLPVVASPVGINRQLVEHGENGLLAADLDSWREALETLVRDPELRARMGAKGRERAVAGYSLAVHAPRIVKVFSDCAKPA